MRIQLKRISIVNFKGISKLEVNYNHITNIFGDNATGKTTVFDAFLWLFFGKNSEGVSQFEIKRLDANNKFIKDLESEVEAIVQTDGQEISIKKVLRQKWVKRRGELESNYNGDENIYYWNDVPLKESEFKTKVKDIVDETLFRLITNPFYFNSLKWQERRNTLIEIVGSISNDEVFDSIITATNKHQYDALINALNQKKTVDEFKREIAAKKKKIKDESENIPSRIDEVRRGLPGDIDFNAIKVEIKNKESELATIDASINDKLSSAKAENERRSNILKEHNQKVQDRQQKIFGIKTQMQNIEFEAKQKAKESSSQIDAEIKSVQSKITDKKLDRERYQNSVNEFKNQKTKQEASVQSLREDYAKADAEQLVFDDHAFTCPTCQQSLPASNIETKKTELTANFNNNKLANLNKIVANAEAAKKDIEVLQSRIANGEKTIADLDVEINSLQEKLTAIEQQAAQPAQSIDDIINNILSENSSYQKLKVDLKSTEDLVLVEPKFEETSSDVHDDLNSQKSLLQNSIIELNKELAKEQQIEAGNKRIQELELQENTLSQELAELEGTEYAIMQFTKAKVDAIERKINGKFKFVKFKMFDTQVNGGEVECCETLINTNGSFVPFNDANNAAKINAGIDIINTLCQHYNIYAPIFIDNRESVTKLIDSDSQIVNLIVSEADKKLRVA